MIEKLEQLTVSQFVDLICGDASVLIDKEVVPHEKVVIAMRDIVFEYKTIADNAGVKSYLSFVDELLKTKLSLIIFSICSTLATFKEFGKIKEIMEEYGMSVGTMNQERLQAEIVSRLERAKSDISKLEKEGNVESVDASRIRSDFDAQTAALMAHFKFQIDITTMKATIYAHLVARYNREIKAMIKATKR